MAVYDVPATELIEAIAADLKKDVKQPEWADFIKSGRHRERAPHRRDWFHVRMASVLYRIYKRGNVGTNRLKTYYGGRRNRGVAPHHFYKASGKVIRVCLQELEKLGFVKKEKEGRKITGKGESYLNSKAKELGKVVAERLKQEKEEADRIAGEAREKAKAAAREKEVKKEESARKEAVGKEERPVEVRQERKEIPAEKKSLEKAEEKRVEGKAEVKEESKSAAKPGEKGGAEEKGKGEAKSEVIEKGPEEKQEKGEKEVKEKPGEEQGEKK